MTLSGLALTLIVAGSSMFPQASRPSERQEVDGWGMHVLIQKIKSRIP